MSDCCGKGHLHSGTPKGSWGQLGNLKAYITGNQNSPRAILYIHDAFGVTLPNNQLLPDTYADGIDARVYVPDFFDGQHVPFDHFTNNEVKVDPDFDLQKFLSQNGRSVRMQSIVQAVQDIKALPGVHKIGVVGFCWGGWGSIAMGSHEEVDAVGIAHPGGIEYPKDFEALIRPSLFLCAELEFSLPDSERDGGKEILEKRGIYNKFVIYRGAAHGFAVRGNENNETEAKAMEEAKDEAISFFNKFLN